MKVKPWKIKNGLLTEFVKIIEHPSMTGRVEVIRDNEGVLVLALNNGKLGIGFSYSTPNINAPIGVVHYAEVKGGRLDRKGARIAGRCSKIVGLQVRELVKFLDLEKAKVKPTVTKTVKGGRK